MNSGTCIIFIMFYIFRHYKRVEINSNINEFISDMKKCHLLLTRMERNIEPSVSTEIVTSLIDRINSWGATMRLQSPLRYVDSYDHDIIVIMIRLIDEIITFAKKPFYKKHSNEIFIRLLILHNLPRVLLDNSSGDSSTLKNLHISKQEALEYISTCLGDAWLSKMQRCYKLKHKTHL